MGRGYVVGLLAGALFSGVSVSALSLMLSPVGTVAPDAAEVPVVKAPEPAPVEPLAEAPVKEPEALAEAPAGDPPAAPETAGVDPSEAEAEIAAIEPPDSDPAPVTEPAPAPEAPAAAQPAPDTAPATAGEAATAEAPAPTEEAALTSRPETPAVEVPAGSEFNRPKPEEEPLVPAPQPAPAASATPRVTAPAADDGPTLTERSPAAIPEGQAEAPAAPAEPATAAPEAAAPAPADESAVPVPPPGEAILPDLAPAEPDSAAVAPAESAPAPATGFARPASRLPQITPPAVPDAGAEVPITPAQDSEAETETALLPPAGVAPAGNKPRILTPGTNRTTENGPVIIDVAPQQPVGAAPQVGFGQKVPGVQVNRLPRIGGAEAEPAPDADAAGAAPETAVTRFRAAFENAGKKPVIAIVLIDDGTAAAAEPEAIGEIGAPVTVALNPENTGASVLAQSHRLAGDEVAILMPAMPQGATPSDLEVSYQAYVQTLPESVALVATPESPLQNDRMVAQHMAALLMTEGRGLVTSEKGLNPARQAAERAGLPYAGVTRSLDEAGGDEAAILRLLDRAAFDAVRGGSVVVMGLATPATVAAIRAWNEAGGHEAIVGPLSAALAP